MGNSIIDRAALLTMQTAARDASEARETRSDRRATEAEERLERVVTDHTANHKEVLLNITRSEIAFGTSFGGAIGGIVAKSLGFAYDEGQGHQVANLRRTANLAGMRAEHAKSDGDDATADVEARGREMDRASEQALSLNEQRKSAVNIA